MDIFEQAGQQYNVDPQLLRAQMQVESGGNSNAVSPQGAQGPMQLMPATAKSLGVSNPFDKNQAVMGAAKLMAENLDRYGNVQQAVAAYHGGTDPANWGPKTQAYVQKVASNYGGNSMAAQSQQMPGLPPVNAPQQGMVDPFAGLQGASGAAPAQQQQVDPFAGLDSNAAATPAPPRPAPAPPPAPQGSQPGMLASLGAGLGHGVQQSVLGAQQLLGRGITALGSNTVGPWLSNDAEQGIARGNAQYAPYSAANPMTAGAGNIIGQGAATAPLAMAAPEIGAMGLLGRVGTGAALGAANGAIAPVDNPGNNFWGQKLGQIGSNAAIGGVATPLMAGIGSAVGGVTDAARQRLAQAGVTMTPGQLLGGAWQATENKLTSVPVLGDMIRNAQQRSVQSFNRAAYDSALAPIGAQFPADIGAGSNGVTYVRNQIGNVYDSIVPRASFVPDQNFATDLAGIRANLAQNAPGTLQQFDNIVDNQITQKAAASNGTLSGQQWNDSRSAIGGIARNRMNGNSTPDDRTLADALGDLTDAMNAGVGRSSPPDILPTLQRANAAYAQYKQIERAAGSVGASNNGNVFTAAQFANGVRNGTTAFQRATNSGLNGGLAADATGVLGNTYPDSGTVGRSLLTLGLGALAGHSVAPGAVIPGALGIGAASLPYTGLGGRLAQGLLMNRPAFAQPVANAITNGAAPLLPGLLGAFAH